MSPGPEVVPIFATPFSVVSLPSAAAHNTALAAHFTACMQQTGPASVRQGSAHTFCSPDDLTESREAAVATLVEEMLQGVTSVATSISELAPDQFARLRREARCWFTVIHGNGYLAPQIHPNTSWAAVYCVSAPPASPTRRDSGMLRLHEFRPWTMFVDSALGAGRVPYRPGHCNWRPVPGHMAIFPGAITHEVALLRADSPLILVTARVRFVGHDQPWMPPW